MNRRVLLAIWCLLLGAVALGAWAALRHEAVRCRGQGGVLRTVGCVDPKVFR